MHEGMLRERKYDVYKKYVEQEVLGQGSMGHVARVQIREGCEGGSAFVSEHSKHNKKDLGKTTSSLSERRQNKVDYALKSIQLDRVSPQFLDELRNEINILKGLVGWILCGAVLGANIKLTLLITMRSARIIPIL